VRRHASHDFKDEFHSLRAKEGRHVVGCLHS
jgi:hypothetical protein